MTAIQQENKDVSVIVINEWLKKINKLSLNIAKSKYMTFQNASSKKIGILNELKHVLSQQIKALFYNSLIVPHINY